MNPVLLLPILWPLLANGQTGPYALINLEQTQGLACTPQNNVNLGPVQSLGECEALVVGNARCNAPNEVIMYSKAYSYAWGCRCCLKTSPGAHKFWDFYLVSRGGTPAPTTYQATPAPTPTPNPCKDFDLPSKWNGKCKDKQYLNDQALCLAEPDFAQNCCFCGGGSYAATLPGKANTHTLVNLEVNHGLKCMPNQNVDLGPSTTLRDCESRVLDNPRCNAPNEIIMFSKAYSYAWGCRCCLQTAPGAHTYWDFYTVTRATPTPTSGVAMACKDIYLANKKAGPSAVTKACNAAGYCKGKSKKGKSKCKKTKCKKIKSQTACLATPEFTCTWKKNKCK